jgi:fructose-1,6-bisphosphatase/inositol monophosphatase family enzyme
MPALGETVAAGRGLGCFIDGQPARVSAKRDLEGAIVTTSGYEGWSEEQLLRVKRAGCVLRTWGDGYGYALVATGRVDAMVDPVASPWDLAPMPVVLGEAGGCFSAVDGSVGIDTGTGVATNARIHDALLVALGGRAE